MYTKRSQEYRSDKAVKKNTEEAKETDKTATERRGAAVSSSSPIRRQDDQRNSDGAQSRGGGGDHALGLAVLLRSLRHLAFRRGRRKENGRPHGRRLCTAGLERSRQTCQEIAPSEMCRIAAPAVLTARPVRRAAERVDPTPRSGQKTQLSSALWWLPSHGLHGKPSRQGCTVRPSWCFFLPKLHLC